MALWLTIRASERLVLTMAPFFFHKKSFSICQKSKLAGCLTNMNLSVKQDTHWVLKYMVRNLDPLPFDTNHDRYVERIATIPSIMSYLIPYFLSTVRTGMHNVKDERSRLNAGLFKRWSWRQEKWKTRRNAPGIERECVDTSAERDISRNSERAPIRRETILHTGDCHSKDYGEHVERREKNQVRWHVSEKKIIIKRWIEKPQTYRDWREWARREKNERNVHT